MGIEQEEGDLRLAEVSDLSGGPAKTREEVIAKVKALASHVIAVRPDHGENIPELDERLVRPA